MNNSTEELKDYLDKISELQMIYLDRHIDGIITSRQIDISRILEQEIEGVKDELERRAEA